MRARAAEIRRARPFSMEHGEGERGNEEREKACESGSYAELNPTRAELEHG